MRSTGNVIWFVLFGWHLALAWLIAGAIFAISIVGIPLTRAAFEMAKMSAFPFGKEIVHVRDLDQKGLTRTTASTGTIGFAFNVLWMITFGWVLFVYYLLVGVLACFTLILIPFGLQSFKLAAISFWPVGRRVVPVELAQVVRGEKADRMISKYRRGS